MRQGILGVGLLVCTLCSCGSSIGSPKSLAESGQVKALALGLLDVYFVEGRGEKSLLRSTVKDGSEEPVDVALIDGSVSAMAVDDRWVFAVVRKADRPGSSLVRVSRPEPRKVSNQKEIVRSPATITGIALDAVQLYFTQSGDNKDPDESHSSGVMRTMRFGGTPFPVAPKQAGTPLNLIVSATHVLWVNAEYGKQFAVMSWRKLGGEATAIHWLSAAETGDAAPVLATDDSFVYLKTRSAILRLPVAGGGLEALGKVADSNVAPLVVDSRHLYFVRGGDLLRYGFQSRAEEPFSGVRGLLGMAVDERFVFAVSSEGLFRLRKR